MVEMGGNYDRQRKQRQGSTISDDTKTVGTIINQEAKKRPEERCEGLDGQSA
ncbi:hypothetical protein HFZ78_18735 [Priestia megaterium]|uniref:Uncharacterized protein n=1 Tax=Priestia megaterium TaxID=1404 RepID=A0A6H1P4X8_PRIMG|nr:hypothetical protein [Priestia megaterium]QIZ08492.1 hypothetical protein HFZ78_18735 [Priestia megaterium]